MVNLKVFAFTISSSISEKWIIFIKFLVLLSETPEVYSMLMTDTKYKSLMVDPKIVKRLNTASNFQMLETYHFPCLR